MQLALELLTELILATLPSAACVQVVVIPAVPPAAVLLMDVIHLPMVSAMVWEQVQLTASHLSPLVQPATALSSAPQEYAQETNASLTSGQPQLTAAGTTGLLHPAVQQLIFAHQAITSQPRHVQQALQSQPAQQRPQLIHVQYAVTVMVAI
jgi:hypothetical protein